MCASDRTGKPRVLFVCALNQWRSPTAERLYRDDSRLEVRSAGTRTDAHRRLSAKDLEWADVVFTMNREQRSRIIEQFRGLELPPIQVLDIPDSYPYMHPTLQQLLREAIDPEIETLLASDDDRA